MNLTDNSLREIETSGRTVRVRGRESKAIVRKRGACGSAFVLLSNDVAVAAGDELVLEDGAIFQVVKRVAHNHIVSAYQCQAVPKPKPKAGGK